MTQAAVTSRGEGIEPTPRSMREVLGTFVTGVTVVTGLDGEEPVGFACQAFASVSLAPPLVMFCAGHESRSWPRIRAAGRFGVNILADDQRDLIDRFGSREGRKFDGLDWQVSPWGTPVFDDVLGRVHADIEAVHPAGDHDVVIGRVLGLEALRPERPMVFYRGQFDLDDAAA